MKYWLIIFFLDSHGEFIGKRETAYKNEVQCYQAMDRIRMPRYGAMAQMVCVSDDHHAGRKQDPGVPYD